MPVPHDGALLGWVTDSQVTAMLVAHCRPPEPWDTSATVPEIRVMPMAGAADLLHWPPFTASPLQDGRLWEYVEWGEIVDLGPLVIQSAGQVFWVPSPDRGRSRRGCVVVMGNLPAEEYWLPAGVYTGSWTLAKASSRRPPASSWPCRRRRPRQPATADLRLPAVARLPAPPRREPTPTERAAAAS